MQSYHKDESFLVSTCSSLTSWPTLFSCLTSCQEQYSESVDIRVTVCEPSSMQTFLDLLRTISIFGNIVSVHVNPFKSPSRAYIWVNSVPASQNMHVHHFILFVEFHTASQTGTKFPQFFKPFMGFLFYLFGQLFESFLFVCLFPWVNTKLSTLKVKLGHRQLHEYLYFYKTLLCVRLGYRMDTNHKISKCMVVPVTSA